MEMINSPELPYGYIGGQEDTNNFGVLKRKTQRSYRAETMYGHVSGRP